MADAFTPDSANTPTPVLTPDDFAAIAAEVHEHAEVVDANPGAAHTFGAFPSVGVLTGTIAAKVRQFTEEELTAFVAYLHQRIEYRKQQLGIGSPAVTPTGPQVYMGPAGG